MKFPAKTVAKINHFILVNIERCPNDISQATQSHFGISKQTAFNYISKLEKENLIKKTSKGRYPNYRLVNSQTDFEYKNIKSLSEEKILVNDIAPLIQELPQNVRYAFDYTVSEMVNNVIDHSNATLLKISVTKNSVWTQISVTDNGIGIFDKIKSHLNLDSPDDALIELSKGKFTSDAKHHSGEGIFFTSKICDDFAIMSKKLVFKGDRLGTMLAEQNSDIDGTAVFLRIYNKSKVSTAKVFDEYSDFEKTPSFYKTKIQLKLMEKNGVILVSRSQAKRLVNRLENFLEIILDFKGITEIGQGFADEIFRVFQNEHPKIRLVPINCSQKVQKMIAHTSS